MKILIIAAFAAAGVLSQDEPCSDSIDCLSNCKGSTFHIVAGTDGVPQFGCVEGLEPRDFIFKICDQDPPDGKIPELIDNEEACDAAEGLFNGGCIFKAGAIGDPTKFDESCQQAGFNTLTQSNLTVEEAFS
jgi:hypothetical protein